VNEILIGNAAVSAIIREAPPKTSGRDCFRQRAGMQFMDDALFCGVAKRTVTPHEAFMKAIDKNRFKQFLPAEDAHLGDAAGAVPNDEKGLPGNFMRRAATRSATSRHDG